jgi:type I restriction enzyme R subunit
MAAAGNFDFLALQDERLARPGALAERYFFDDAPAALIKLRQLAEFIAKDVAARHALLPKNAVTFDDVLRTLKLNSLLPREIAGLFFHLKRVGNAAVHEGVGTAGEALEALKIARTAAVWFHRSYGNAPQFKPGPFVPPVAPVDSPITLLAELEQLRAPVRASADSEAKIRLAHQEAEAAHLTAIAEAEARESERQFPERYAAETEAGLRETEAALKAAQAAAAAAPARQLDQLAQFATRQAGKVDLDETTTRVLIDSQLRSAGWIVDSERLRHSAGVRPQPGQSIAIAEWPTDSGPVDYALFIEGRCVGVIEAKRKFKDVPGRLGQTRRYGRDIRLSPDETPPDGPWNCGLDQFRVPFHFVTNGRRYVKQLETKSGIWFWDARPAGGEPRALSEWFSPRDVKERLEQATSAVAALAERELGVTGLRPYQNEAIAAVEDAVSAGQSNILLAMATGTGKTRLAIALMYEFLRRKRFRRILSRWTAMRSAARPSMR